MLLHCYSAGGGHKTPFLVTLSTQGVWWVAKCREVWNCKVTIAAVNVEIPAVWTQFGQSVFLEPPTTGVWLEINWSLKPFARETNTLQISSVNVGLHLNIAVCLDHCSKSSATFLCLYRVVEVWFGKNNLPVLVLFTKGRLVACEPPQGPWKVSSTWDDARA